MFLLLVTAALARCPDLPDTLDAWREALLFQEREAAARAEVEATDALQCAPASPDLTARYFLYRGATLRLLGQPGSEAWFAASRALQPEPDLSLGPDLAAAFREAPDPAGEAQLSLDPATPGYVDGRRYDVWPATVPAGPHVVQVRTDDDRVLYAATPAPAPDQSALLQTGLPATVRLDARPSPAWLISGSTLLVGGGLLAFAAYSQGVQAEEIHGQCMGDGPCNEDGFFAAGKRGDWLTAGAYSMWGLGAASVTAHFVVPVRK